MFNYSIRKLEKNNLQEFKFIAAVHESLPAAWIEDYIIEEKEVEKSMRKLIEKHKGHNIYCGVAEDLNEIISFIWAQVNEENTEKVDIISLWTHENYRRQGIAKKLKIQLEEWARRQGNIKKIQTTVSAGNRGMIHLNQKLGYGIDYYKMSKNISK